MGNNSRRVVCPWPVGRGAGGIATASLCGTTQAAHLLSNCGLISDRIGVKFDLHVCRLDMPMAELSKLPPDILPIGNSRLILHPGFLLMTELERCLTILQTS